MGSELATEQQASASLGKYQVLSSLGRGGMADAYLAIARGPMGFNKLSVLKRLRHDRQTDPAFLDMLLDEARLSARLNHPNVVHTYEVGEHDHSYFIAMEYLEGQPLNRVLRAMKKEGQTRFPHAFWARILADALSGLHHAHELRDYDGTPLGIIHRDVSPHNIFVTYDGQVKLMDFGIAKAASSSTHTATGVLKGKIAYMSPERVSGTIDRRTDIFAMGIVLWETLTGERLFSRQSTAATLHRMASHDAPRVSSIAVNVDPRLDAIVAKALCRDPEGRYQTALDMRNALDAFLAESGAIVRPDEIGQRVSALFAQTREQVRLEIQVKMGAISQTRMRGIERTGINIEGLKSIEPPSSRQSMPSHSSANVSSAIMSRAQPAGNGAIDAQRNTRRAFIAGFAVLVLLGVGLGEAAVSGRAGNAATTESIDPAGAPETGYLSLESDSPARVFEGDRVLGMTPLVGLALAPGSHTLTLEDEHGVRQEIAVTMTPGETTTRKIALK